MSVTEVKLKYKLNISQEKNANAGQGWVHTGISKNDNGTHLLW